MDKEITFSYTLTLSVSEIVGYSILGGVAIGALIFLACRKFKIRDFINDLNNRL